MKNIATAEGIVYDSEYPMGYKISPGITKVSATINQDIVTFFQKLLELSDITINNEFDNEVNGYQTLEALKQFYIKEINAVPADSFSITTIEDDITTSMGYSPQLCSITGNPYASTKSTISLIIYIGYDTGTAFHYNFDIIGQYSLNGGISWTVFNTIPNEVHQTISGQSNSEITREIMMNGNVVIPAHGSLTIRFGTVISDTHGTTGTIFLHRASINVSNNIGIIS
jgi:hypothetical protein